MTYRRNVYDITPAMGDILVVLAGAPSHQTMRADEIAAQMPGYVSQRLGKPLAGLRIRGLIHRGQANTWKIRWEGIPNQLWGRIMVDHARRHDYPISSVMTEEDMRLCEVAA
jgi:hypothetical protein